MKQYIPLQKKKDNIFTYLDVKKKIVAKIDAVKSRTQNIRTVQFSKMKNGEAL